ncbi:MAG: hypothetical protein KAT94_03415 [Candidatus Aenigmarchaeota archaeon]|nr:hypothetical protein [Candidatus Aenigmarchaeota archaeon]
MIADDTLKKERNYNEKEINFDNLLNEKIYALMPVTELTWISGGCKKEISGAIRVNKYPLVDQNPCDPKAKTINGIFCQEAFNGDLADDSCEKCEFYGKKHESPIYEFIGRIKMKRERKLQ